MSVLARGIAWIAHGIALVLTALLCVLLVPLVVVGVVAGSAQQVLAPGVWKDALAAEGVYERLPLIAATQMTHQLAVSSEAAVREGEAGPAEGGAPLAIRDLTAAQMEAILREILPPAWLRAQTERAIDGLLADPLPSGPVTISLVELKAHLESGAAVRAYAQLVKAQRPCTAEEIAAWGGTTDLPSCRPPDEVLALAEPLIGETLAAVAAKLPDEVDVTQLGAGAPEDDGAAQATTAPPGDMSARIALERSRDVLRVAMGLGVPVALLVVLLGVRSRRAFLGWLGTPLLFGGLIALAIGLEGAPLAERALAAPRAMVPGAYSPLLVDVVFDVARGIAERVAASLTIMAAAVSVAGAAMLAIAPLAARRGVPADASDVVQVPVTA